MSTATSSTSTTNGLEFLGDSVFGLLVSDYLYAKLPIETEGHLSHLRSQIVEASSCVQMIQKLDVARICSAWPRREHERWPRPRDHFG